MDSKHTEPTHTSWHSLSPEQVLAQLDTSEQGLPLEQAQQRLREYGPNLLPQARRLNNWQRFGLQFHNILIYVLLAAAVVTSLLGHLVDAGVIFGVVLINALIGFVQEGKAEKALDAVRQMLSPQAAVLRDGHRRMIPAEELVPGDLVQIQSGDRVPADLRLIRLRDLRIDEAMLTGESVPSEKALEAVAADAALGDRANMAYSGTLVNFGQATGVVVATGARTEIGHISALLAGVQTLETPLTRQMAGFARVLTGAILLIALATALFGVWVQAYAPSEMFLAAVGLAVAAIPEGLPAIITITLAIGVQRMAGRNAIIRRLPAVETLGSVSTICSDKTGTLTRNEMTVTEVVSSCHRIQVSGSGYDPHGSFSEGELEIEAEELPALRDLSQACLLCNDAAVFFKQEQWQIDGDPTEGALVVLGMKAGLDPHQSAEAWPRTDVIPFEAQHRFMASMHHDHEGHGFIYLKGAPEVILPRCQQQRAETGDEPLDQAFWHAEVERLARQGQRTLALALKTTHAEHAALSFDDVEQGLVLLGLVGIIDPPREEAIRAVADCRSAGIRVKMITGDHAITAQAIAGQMGIGDGQQALSGPQLDQLDDAALSQIVLDTDVFARASPEHKLRLVTALQARGQVIAMTGDGVNDAPALKRADVGVAMGIKGTEAAKEAAEMVLADDNFASIAHAVEEGRTVYDNIKKSILFILPTNGGQALIILLAIALGEMLPVTATQILWVNMVTAVTLALSLAFESAERDIMGRAPRNSSEPLLSGYMLWRIGFVSLLMVAVAFGLFLWERGQGASIELARTVAVNTLVVAEAFYLLNSRFLRAPALTRNGLLGNPWVLLAIALVLLFQLLFTYLPLMQLFFNTVPLQAEAWGRIFAAGLVLFLLVELEKWTLRKFEG
ncbi:MAG: cation-transporting P-type ATPase [Gammaproteobacteria bacterium]|nr:cation-transporting P-type ATPase [Gammaproteobacteria bacterium]